MAAHLTLGLVPAPGLSEKLACKLAEALPELLRSEVDGNVSWEVTVRTDPLTGSDIEAPDLLTQCRKRKEEEGWDLALFLTDLPILRDRRVVVATESQAQGTGGFSLPALGALHLYARARETALQLIRGIHGMERERDAGSAATPRSGPGRPFQLYRGPLSQRVAPIRQHAQIQHGDSDFGGDVEYTSPKWPALLRILPGMVRNNSPWNLFPSFRGVFAAAFATGAYVLFFTSMYQVSATLGGTRLLALMLLSLGGITVWTIIAHNLWERDRYRRSTRELTMLYNAATLLTMSTAAVMSYAALYGLLLVAGAMFVPREVFQSSMRMVVEGYSVGWGDYFTLAWMATSLATIGGALGTGLEDEENVRQAAFGYRQRKRTQSEST
ncbi:hypothetical protein [Thiohalorhabdus methylotrophus]|uniref:5,10-methylene-tetrahydrofolate dehydrogenase n=1 Tax=Thiohalorhabdus methylotrophus TaxID=3242694 RepID=A0ABV4TR91_9GAMM